MKISRLRLPGQRKPDRPADAGLRRLIVCLGPGPALSRWASFDGLVWRSGTGSLEALDAADRTEVRAEVRVPAQDILLLRLELPTTNRARIAQALPFALEEQLVGEPADFEFAYRILAPGRLAVAAIARHTLAEWERVLAAAGIRPLTLVPQNLTLPWQPLEWTLAEDAGVLLVRTGEAEGFALLHGGMPATEWIQAALRESPEPPERLCLVRGQAEQLVDPVRLGLPTTQAEWTPCLPVDGPVALNLLAGLESATEQPLWKALRPAALIFGIWLVLGLLSHMVLWFRWHRIAQAQEAQMLSLFEQSFPREQEVVDPPVQMRRDLAALKQRTGVVSHNDLLPLLNRLAVAFGGNGAPVLRNLDYRARRLRIGIQVSGFSALDNLKAQLRAQGLQVKVINADSTATGQVHGTLEVRASL